MTHRRWVGLCIAVCVLTFMAACATNTGSPAERPATQTDGPGGLAYASWFSATADLGDSGELRGTVVGSGGCLRVTSYGQDYTPILPDGGSDWGALRPGDEVALRGGIVDSAPDGAEVPDVCGSGPFWLVVPEP